MKRYDLRTNYRCGSAIEEMEPADDGEWVRFDEAEAALRDLKEQNQSRVDDSQYDQPLAIAVSNEPVLPRIDNAIVDFLVAFHGYPDRATALRIDAARVFDEANLIESWRTLHSSGDVPSEAADASLVALREQIEPVIAEIEAAVESCLSEGSSPSYRCCDVCTWEWHYEAPTSAPDHAPNCPVSRMQSQLDRLSVLLSETEKGPRG